MTISMDLEHRSGVLSKVLGSWPAQEGNVLTIHQSIPLQGLANVVISVDISLMGGTLSEFWRASQAGRRQQGVGHRPRIATEYDWEE